jgi:hypothetical protein
LNFKDKCVYRREKLTTNNEERSISKKVPQTIKYKDRGGRIQKPNAEKMFDRTGYRDEDARQVWKAEIFEFSCWTVEEDEEEEDEANDLILLSIVALC